jgi:hypothetical protein
MLKTTCPHCGEGLAIPEEYAGTTGACKHCGGQIHVPTVKRRAKRRIFRWAVAGLALLLIGAGTPVALVFCFAPELASTAKEFVVNEVTDRFAPAPIVYYESVETYDVELDPVPEDDSGPDYAADLARTYSYCDLGQVTDDSVKKEFELLWSMAVASFPRNTKRQINDGVLLVYSLKQIYPDVTVLSSIEAILDALPDQMQIELTTYEDGQLAALSSDEFDALIAEARRLDLAQIQIDLPSVNDIAREVYSEGAKDYQASIAAQTEAERRAYRQRVAEVRAGNAARLGAVADEEAARARAYQAKEDERRRSREEHLRRTYH